MSTTIESLELEIKSNSSNAKSGIEELAKSLEKLKSATKGGLGLKAVATQIGAVSTAVNSIQADSVNKMSGLASAIQMLSGVKISPTISKNLSGITSALNGMSIDSSATTKIQELITTLQPLYDLPKQNFSSVVTAIKNIPKALTELNAIDMDAFKTKVLEVTDAVRPLATEMNKVAAGFASFPSRIQKLISTNERLEKSNTKTGHSFLELGSKITVAFLAIKRGISAIGSFITKASDYIENLNLFTVAMGEYATEAKEYAEQVAEIMGIDPGEWMRNQGLFQTLITGFGVAGDSASLMSQNLTQLAYDLSSFYNIDVETAMQKLKSGMAGELEPLRAIGYDLSQAKLEATAAALGIDKSVSSMTQAEKSMLRYYAIMTQVTTSHGDMAKTLEQPANQLRILKAQLEMLGREIGNVFMPLLQTVLPYLIAATKVLREIVSAIATLVGYVAPDDITEGLTSGTESAQESLEGATDSAKKLKSYMMGFDELNVINPSTDSSEDGLGAFDIELPTYDFLTDLVDGGVLGELVDKMKEWLGITDGISTWSDLLDTRFGDILKTVGLIGVGILAWKIAPGLATMIDTLSKMKSSEWVFKITGLSLIMSDLDKLKQYFDDFLENGATFTNVTGMLSEFVGSLGDVMIALGKVQIGGALKVVQGFGEIMSAIDDIGKNGADFTNITDLIRGISNIAIGLGFLNNDMQLVGKGMIIQGLTTIIQELAENWEAIKQGDWSGVDKATLVVGAITMIGGIVTALDVFSKLKQGSKIGDVAKDIGEVTTATESVSTATSTMSTKLKNLATNLAWGLVILAEVAAAAILIVGSIAILGWELEQVGKAWEPVIENGATVLAALVLGTTLLVTLGAVTSALGSAGAPLVASMALGTAVLALAGAATILFTAEILLIGKLLDEVGKAWEPVIENGETITLGILNGTAMLVGIGVVVAALGVATVATAGLLPLAIGIGTAMLVELCAAFVVFTENLIIVAKQLKDELHPALESTSEILPGLTTNMSDFTDFMSGFAGQVVRYSLDTAIAGIAGTISKVIGFFTGDPVKQMTAEVKSQNNQFEDLVDELEEVIPKIKKAIELQNEYRQLMSEFGQGSGGGVLGAIGSFFGGIGDAIGSLFGRSGGESTVSVGTIPAYASGGFPDSGQAFIARENGIPEMVGTIGRRTAVANNEQIVESVASGVAEANSEQNMLLREQNTLLRALLEKDSGVYLDGRSLSASVDKYKREQGRVLITGGAL